MAINKTLAQARGISQEDQDKIEELHTLVQSLIDAALEEGYPDKEEIVELIHEAEFAMQKLWNLPRDAYCHTRVNEYDFKFNWAGKRYLCRDTGVTKTLPKDIKCGDFFPIGNGFVDVGDGYYYRIGGNVVEVCV